MCVLLEMSDGNGLGDGWPPLACRLVCLFLRTFLVLASFVGSFGCVLSLLGLVLFRNAAPSLQFDFFDQLCGFGVVVHDARRVLRCYAWARLVWLDPRCVLHPLWFSASSCSAAGRCDACAARFSWCLRFQYGGFGGSILDKPCRLRPK